LQDYIDTASTNSRGLCVIDSEVPPLPDGNFEVWRCFLQNDGYFTIGYDNLLPPKKYKALSPLSKLMAVVFVANILFTEDPSKKPHGMFDTSFIASLVWRPEQLRFHHVLKVLREGYLEAPRDTWESCLPPESNDNYEFATLLLMLCSSMCADTQLVPFMKNMFKTHEITP